MIKEEIIKEIEKAMKQLETVNCMTINRAEQTSSSKKVNTAYEILDKLKKEIIGGTNEIKQRRL